MGVLKKHDALRRLWRALPNDFTGKWAFSAGVWVNPLNVNCSEILDRPCREQLCGGIDLGPFSSIIFGGGIGLACDSKESLPTCDQAISCLPLDFPCEEIKRRVLSDCQSKRDEAKRRMDEACAAVPNDAELVRKGAELACDARRNLMRTKCEIERDGAAAACRSTSKFMGKDPILPSTINLVRRSLDLDILTTEVTVPPIPFQEFGQGEAELAGGLLVRINPPVKNHCDERPRNCDDQDLNLIVKAVVAMSGQSRVFPLAPSLVAAVNAYATRRLHSYGSYLERYYREFGHGAVEPDEMIDKIEAGIRRDGNRMVASHLRLVPFVGIIALERAAIPPSLSSMSLFSVHTSSDVEF